MPASSPALVDLSQTHVNTMLIVVTSKEDVSWTQRQPYPVALMTKGLPLGTPFNTPQTLRGREAISYLQFIIDNYHHLPEHMVFLHGHLSARHIKVLRIFFVPLDFVFYQELLICSHMQCILYACV